MAAIVTQIAVTSIVLLLRTPAPSTTVVETHAPIQLSFPITIEAPLSPPPASAARACPLPRTDAPRAKRVNPPQDVNRVTPSLTNAGWIAAWDDQHVMLSTDAGVSFDRVLDGPGNVGAVAFDCFGNLVVVRDQQLGIREGARERWQRVPAGLRGNEDDPVALIGGGPDVIMIGIARGDTWQARLAVSADLGASWWYSDLIEYWESSRATGRQTSDGAIDIVLTTADCMSDPQTRFRIRAGKVVREELGDASEHPEPDYVRDAAGRRWSIDETKDGEAAWAVVKD
jgi:hypothetical protein